MKLKGLLVTAVLLAIIVVGVLSTLNDLQNNAVPEQPASTSTGTPILAPAASSSASIPEPTPQETYQKYRNEEWGFEFQYPEEWTWHEAAFYNPSSKFNLVGVPPGKTYPNPIAPPILINIVTSEFADHAFHDLKNEGSEKIIQGVRGLIYAYQYEDAFKYALVLPLGREKIILGAYEDYLDIFNQILASFKFIPSAETKTYRNEE